MRASLASGRRPGRAEPCGRWYRRSLSEYLGQTIPAGLSTQRRRKYDPGSPVRDCPPPAITLSPSNSPRSPKPLLVVRMMLPRSYRADTRVKKAVADSRSRRQDQSPRHLPRCGAFQSPPAGRCQWAALDVPDVVGPRPLGRMASGVAGCSVRARPDPGPAGASMDQPRRGRRDCARQLILGRGTRRASRYRDGGWGHGLHGLTTASPVPVVPPAGLYSSG